MINRAIGALKMVSVYLGAGFSLIAFADVPKSTPGLIATGKRNFGTYCATCHGAQGNGDGIAAAPLNPKPRNFHKEKFKFGSTPEEVFKTITQGVSGTAMAPFVALSENDRWSLVYFVLSLTKKK